MYVFEDLCVEFDLIEFRGEKKRFHFEIGLQSCCSIVKGVNELKILSMLNIV